MGMKTCTKCREEKALEAFARDAKRRDGLQPWCRGCIGEWRLANRERLLEVKKADYRAKAEHYRALGMAWNAANGERKRLTDKRWREENRERKAALDRAWYDRNKDRKLAYDAVWAPVYRAAHKPENAKRRAKRRAMQLAAMPAWVDQAALQAIYDQRAVIERETGIPHEVDHIVPLAGKTVCGLHVPWNLRVIPAAENRSKGHKLIEEIVHA